jgi:O-antigen/teichoic acid export membrane protein
MQQPDKAEEKIVIETASPQGQSREAPASYATRFAQGAFWSLVGAVGTRMFSFAGNIVVARVLGQVGFGELAMILSTLGVLGTFSGLGVGGTATRYVAELRLKDPERTGRIIGLTYMVSWIAGGLLALSCFLAAPWLAAKTLNAPHLAPEIRLASLLLFITAGFGPQVNILSGFQAFRAISKVNWWTGLSSLPITLTLVWLAGLWGVILAFILNAFLAAVVAAFFLRREYKAAQICINFQRAWQERPVLWGFSLPAFLSSLLFTPTLWAANLILVHQPNGYAQLGLVNAAMQYRWLIGGINLILSTVSVSLMSEIHGKNDPVRLSRFFNVNLRLTLSLAVLLGFAILLLSPWLMEVFGAKFRLAAPLLPIVICYSVTGLSNSIFSQIYYSSGRMWVTFKIQLIWCLLMLIMVFYLVPLYLGKGQVLSYLMGSSFVVILNLIVIKKIFGRAMLTNITGCILALISLLAGGLVLSFRQLFGQPVIIVGLLCISGLFLIIKSNFAIFQSVFYQISEIIMSKKRILYAARK